MRKIYRVEIFNTESFYVDVEALNEEDAVRKTDNFPDNRWVSYEDASSELHTVYDINDNTPPSNKTIVKVIGEE